MFTPFSRKELYSFLIIETIASLSVVFLFQALPNKIAGAVGALVFLAVGFYLVFQVKNWPSPEKTYTFYGILAHLTLAVVPLIVLRTVFWQVEFSEIQLGLITGNGFHIFAKCVFLVLMLSHILDLKKAKNY